LLKADIHEAIKDISVKNVVASLQVRLALKCWKLTPSRLAWMVREDAWIIFTQSVFGAVSSMACPEKAGLFSGS